MPLVHHAHELMALDFSGRGEGEFLEDLHRLGGLVGRNLAFEKRDEILERHGLPGPQDEAQATALAEPGIGGADDRRVQGTPEE